MAEDQEHKIEINAYDGAQINIATDNGNISAVQYDIHQKTCIQSNIITYGQNITYTNNFVGRENEINEIIEKLKESNRILISGMGGIGKTTILKKLYHTMVERYKNTSKKFGYFEYELSMDDTIYNALKYEKIGDRNIDVQRAKKVLEDYANGDEIIFFIDNVPIEKYIELQQLDSIKGKIVITSRQNEYENYETVFIDKMSVEECKEIFKKESGILRDSQDLDYIINTLIGRHTLTVKLLAKIAKRKQWTLDGLKNQLLGVGFKIEYRDFGKMTNILTEYKKLYSISELNIHEQNILEGFSLLREAKLDICKYQKFLALDAEDKENDELYELYEKGWLEKEENMFSIHPIFAEFISESREIGISNHLELYKVIKLLCSSLGDSDMLKKQDYLTELISFGKNVSIINNLGNEICDIASFAVHFADYDNAIAILQRIKMDDIEVFINAQLILCDIYVQISEFQKAKECLQRCSNSGINKIENTELFIEYKIDYSLYLDKSTQSDSGREKAIQELEQIIDIEMDETIRGRIYNCLGGFYTDLNRNQTDLDKALKYHKKAEEIREKYDTKIGDLTRTYNNLGRVYYYKSEYGNKNSNLESAEKYYMKSLKLRKRIYNSGHPLIARVLTNLGNVYMKQENYKKALQYMKQGLEMRIGTLGENVWEVGLNYHNIARVHLELEDKENACRCATKAEEICLALYGIDSDVYKKMCEEHSLYLNR